MVTKTRNTIRINNYYFDIEIEEYNSFLHLFNMKNNKHCRIIKKIIFDSFNPNVTYDLQGFELTKHKLMNFLYNAYRFKDLDDDNKESIAHLAGSLARQILEVLGIDNYSYACLLQEAILPHMRASN